jgi:hypothetical protein
VSDPKGPPPSADWRNETQHERDDRNLAELLQEPEGTPSQDRQHDGPYRAGHRGPGRHRRRVAYSQLRRAGRPAAVISVRVFLAFVVLWLAVPLVRRERGPSPDDRPNGRLAQRLARKWQRALARPDD